MKSKHHKEIQQFLWNRKNKPFLFSNFKKKIHGRTDFGGAKYKKWLKENYGLVEWKEKGKVWMQKQKIQMLIKNEGEENAFESS